VAQLLDVVAPALPVAQAIGRLGNWFNQELFGRPTDLPWGLEIDPEHRPAGYLDVATFHPTFLYEALWNLALAGGLVLWERHHPGARPGRLFALYVAGYALGRTWVEALRIDPATRLFGVRWNIWMGAIAFLAAVGWLVFDSWWARRKAESEPTVADTATADTATADTDEADQPTAAETVERAEPAAQPDDSEPAAQPDTAEPADQPDTAEPADQPDDSEPADTTADSEPADTTADSADAAEQPASPAGNDPAAGDATDDEPVAADPESGGAITGEPETSEATDPGPRTGAHAKTADEEAAT
jgi:hypothetical protein